MAPSSTVDLLRKACAGNNLASNATLSEDGKTVTILGTPIDAHTSLTITLNEKTGGTKDVTYTLAAIYLQLLNPGVLNYRKACEAAGVDKEETVKILDKGSITDYFFGGDDDADAAVADAQSAPTDGQEDEKDGGDAMDIDDEAGSADETKEEGDSSKKLDAVKFSAPTSEEKEKHRHKKSSSRSDKERGRRDSRGRDKERSRSSSRHTSDRHRSKSRGSKEEEEGHRKKSSKEAKPKKPITNEQLVANLSTIVDKRDTTLTPTKDKGKEGEDGTATEAATPAAEGTPEVSTQATPATTPVPTDDEGLLQEEDDKKKEKEDRDLLLSWLSPVGFQVNEPTVAAAIEADREAVRRITALEIPVGDSASILRAGAGGEVVEKSGTDENKLTNVKTRDFARVLELYQEVFVAEERAKRAASSSKKRPPPPSGPPGRGSSKSSRTSSGGASSGGAKAPSYEGNPIIVVPNAMTSVITMINAGFFLGKDAVFIPRDQATTNPARGKSGGTISITRKLNARLGGAEVTYDIIDNPATRLKKDEWNRVVAVICQGASWQFRGWRYSEPVDLFSRTFGFYVGMEGANIPKELQGWNVKTGKIARDRRGSDNICLASFWNGVEEFMAVHKHGFIKS